LFSFGFLGKVLSSQDGTPSKKKAVQEMLFLEPLFL